MPSLTQTVSLAAVMAAVVTDEEEEEEEGMSHLLSASPALTLCA
jgi:hypothetical protein